MDAQTVAITIKQPRPYDHLDSRDADGRRDPTSDRELIECYVERISISRALSRQLTIFGNSHAH
jgi:hypothetical protein